MPINRNKLRLVYLTYDEMENLAHLVQMHLTEEGTPKILTRIPLSERYGESLRGSVEKLDKRLREIHDAEADGE